MKTKQISKNIIYSVIEVLVSTGIMFFLYRYILEVLGAKKLGIWSLILATASITNLSEFGLTGSVVKYVAKYIALDEEKKASIIIQTGIITLGFFLALVFTISFYPLSKLLYHLLPSDELNDSLRLLPFALVSMWMTMQAGMIQSGLDGYQRIDIKRIIMILGNIIYFLSSIVLIKLHGLMGLAFSQIIQQLFVITASWLALYKTSSEIPMLPFRWSYKLLKEMISYGVNFQLIAILSMLVDPLTKMLLSKFGSLSDVGYYEMCTKLITKCRAILINANQVLLPVYATYQEQNNQSLVDMYKINSRIIVYLSILGYGFLCSMSAPISYAWIGHKEPFFIFAMIIMSLTWFVHTINAPAYFAFMGAGVLKWNLLGHLASAISTVLFGIAGAISVGSYGIISGRLAASLIGSWITIYFFHKINQIPLGSFWSKDDSVLLALVICSCIIGGVPVFIYSSILGFFPPALTFVAIFIWSVKYQNTGIIIREWVRKNKAL